VARSLGSCLINGLDTNDGHMQARVKWFGANRLNVPSNQMSNLVRSVVPSGSWLNQCKKYLNKQAFECEVIRSGRRMAVSSEHLLVGDIVCLKKGRKVPADGIYIDGDHLELDEGLIFNTTSQQAVNRKTHSSDPFLFSLSEVLKGRGRMLVTCVGESSTLAFYPHTLQFSIVFNNLSRAQKQILERQLSVNVPVGREGFMLVHWVAKYGSVAQLRFLLKNRVDLKMRTMLDQRTPLDLAILYNRALIPVLFGNNNPFFNKANPNLTDVYGRTSLFTAVRYGNAEILRMIVSNNGKLTVVDRFGWTLLHYAVLYNTDNLDYLFSTQVFQRLLDHRDADGKTALMYACWMGNVPVVKQLIQRGASVNVTDYSKRSALHFLAMGDTNPKFIYYGSKRYLVFKCGSRRIPRPKVKKGSPLKEERLAKSCSIYQLLTIVDLLFDHGASANAVDAGGLRPIHYCLMAAQMDKESGTFMRSLLGELIGHPVEQSFDQTTQNNNSLQVEEEYPIVEGAKRAVSTASPSSDGLSMDDDDDLNSSLQEYLTALFEKLLKHGAELSIPQQHHLSDAAVEMEIFKNAHQRTLSRG